MNVLANLSIRTKLYLAMFVTVLLVTLILLAFLQYNTYSFNSYLKQAESGMLDRIAERLETIYAETGASAWIIPEGDFEQWLLQRFGFPFELAFAPPGFNSSENSALPARPAPPPTSLPPFQDRPAFAPMERFESRLVLRDPQRQFLAGSQRAEEAQQSVALMHKGEIIGWLELLPPENSAPTLVTNILAFADGSFANPGLGAGTGSGSTRWAQFMSLQMRIFLTLVLVSTVAILLFGLPLARHFTRRIDTLFEAANKLSQGDFSARIALRGKDELAQLAHRFNYLAEVLQKNKENQRMWVSNISHELRTPLGILKGELEAIEDGVRVADKEEIAMLSNEVEQLNTLINDLFELSRSDVGGLAYNKMPCSLSSILRASIARFRDQMAAKSLYVVDNLAGLGEVPVFGDAQRLGQLFSNLLQNSINYTGAGGTIAVQLDADADFISVTIEDSHPGVATAQLGHLFERFYRAEQSRNRNSGGAGLGLAICKTIAEAHQGAISAAHSALGGVAIKLRLPRS